MPSDMLLGMLAAAFWYPSGMLGSYLAIKALSPKTSPMLEPIFWFMAIFGLCNLAAGIGHSIFGKAKETRDEG